MIKKILLSAGALMVLVSGFLVAMPTLLADEADIVRAPLYRDGSIACTGADDTSRRGGQVVLFPAPGQVHFKVKLNHAEPNKQYTLAVSEEPNCANPQFFPVVTTDANGDATAYGTYTTTAGNKNLLINLGTTGTLNQARNREIGTMNANVVVP